MKKVIFYSILQFIFLGNIFSQSINNDDIEAKINGLIKQMTLEEKASLCSGRDNWSTKPIDRLGIPWIWLSDGPHGLRRAPTTHEEGYGNRSRQLAFQRHRVLLLHGTPI